MAFNTQTFRENVLRVIAVIGLIAVLLLGAWGIIQLAFALPSFFSNIGSFGRGTSAKETISLSVPAATVAERAFPISWTHKGQSGEYSYALSYACADGVSLKAPLPTGAAQAVPCNTPFNYINATSSTPVLLSLSGAQTKPVVFSVTATKLSSGAVTATASSTLSLSAAPATTTTAVKPATPAKKPAASTVKPAPRAQLYGNPDLAVRITSTQTVVRQGERVSLNFIVENIGTNVTPANWSFSANLPYSTTGYQYQSPGQKALYPGDKIAFTLGFTASTNYTAPYTQPYTQYPSYDYASQSGWSYTATCFGDPACNTAGAYGYQNYGQQNYGYQQPQTATISIDPYNYIQELSKYNNIASITYQIY